MIWAAPPGNGEALILSACISTYCLALASALTLIAPGSASLPAVKILLSPIVTLVCRPLELVPMLACATVTAAEASILPLIAPVTALTAGALSAVMLISLPAVRLFWLVTSILTVPFSVAWALTPAPANTSPPLPAIAFTDRE